MSSKIIAGTTSGTALNMSADTSGQLEIQTGATPTTAITVTSAQNVGIGTSSPTQELHLYRSSGATDMLIEQASSGNAYVHTKNTSKEYAVGTRTDALAFFDVTADAERMRIDSSGNLLVNTTSQFGTAKVSIQPATSSDGISVKSNGGGSGTGYAYTSTTTTGYAGYFSTSSGVAGNIYCNGTGTTYATSSDYRLKDNIAPMTGALDKVSALKPVTYTWKHDGSSSEGFIAHELQAIVPEAVVGEKDAVNEDGTIKPQGIDTSFLVATLTAAIQELNAKVEAQAAEIQVLKGKA